MKQYSHSAETIRQFSIVNPHDLFLVRKHHKRNVIHINRSSLDSFISSQLKVFIFLPNKQLATDRLRHEEFDRCLFPLYTLATLLQYQASSIRCYAYVFEVGSGFCLKRSESRALLTPFSALFKPGRSSKPSKPSNHINYSNHSKPNNPIRLHTH